eukprot:TRINITY_DN8593_c0_g1_i1.p2 TRINITY_DN8593_c0_g1~~TRINITY_DN8593_c0_g1_i1.p2  ORF type:complete len:190 (-),score=7.14 TRINITY_DN8593_c0_g1_i1:666-1235(-)
MGNPQGVQAALQLAHWQLPQVLLCLRQRGAACPRPRGGGLAGLDTLNAAQQLAALHAVPPTHPPLPQEVAQLPRRPRVPAHRVRARPGAGDRRACRGARGAADAVAFLGEVAQGGGDVPDHAEVGALHGGTDVALRRGDEAELAVQGLGRGVFAASGDQQQGRGSARRGEAFLAGGGAGTERLLLRTTA